MTDKIDTSKLGRIDLTSGKSAPIEGCVSTWAVDDLGERLECFEMSDAIGDGDFSLMREAADRIQSLIADNERLRKGVERAFKDGHDIGYEDGASAWRPDADSHWNARVVREALSHKDMS